MDESEAADVEVEGATATPIFGVYRRGYDPEQVDRYVADQQRRLDEAIHRASESERKLAAAVGQLRELHRRVAVYESEARNAQPPALDTLGERVQRILQEAWEGAYNLRQEAEREVTDLREQTAQEVNDLRQQTEEELEALRVQARSDVEELRDTASREAAALVDEATRRALHIRDETERRRQAYLERVERDREQAISQITYLYDQRQGAIAELARLQATVQATIEEMMRSPLGRPAPGVAEAAAENLRVARAGTARTHVSPDEPLPGISPGSLSRTEASPDSTLLGDVVTDEAAEPVVDGDFDALGTPTVEGRVAVEAPQLPGLMGEEATPALADTGIDVPTGPMERMARPSDRPAVKSPRHASAEADAMERVMRHGARVTDDPASAAGRAEPSTDDPDVTADPDLTAAMPEGADDGRPRHGRAGSSPSKASAVIGGLVRPRRQPPRQGVYDAEADE